ncbi:hypothetical protein BCF33_1033 [Hasllibacter halocynthiae]|uniref:TspO/MBR related protein n=1 Tax=Hasllibacter halocynthiae TaxID=595589 RepID=A0A2T0X973_9RHOB|nr:hypothetical protein [Hasllibacter halocynthiae]PRY95414.1 hypothetical protein BCF33_1033 [Hasllibacter halocynthiae]
MTLRAALVLLLALAFAISPLFSDFSGFDPALYPVPQEDPPVQPAGIAFSIWSLIYLWLVIHGAFGLWRRREDPVWDAVRWPLIGSLAVGVPWLAVAGASAIWATAMIWAMLVLAVWALMRADRRDRWLLAPPIAIYAGWLTAASCVSVGLMLAGWGVTSETVAAWIGLALALTVAGLVQTAKPWAWEYGAAVVWALFWVVVKNAAGPLSVAVVAGLGALAVVALAWSTSRRAARTA